MTPIEVWVMLREPGVREVVGPIVSRYLAGEMTLDVASRRVAGYLSAALLWKAEHHAHHWSGKVRIQERPPHEYIHLWESLLIHHPGKLRGICPAILPFLPSSVERNPDPAAVYDEAVRWSAFVDAFRAGLRSTQAPAERNRDPAAVYDEAVRWNAYVDAFRAWRDRRLRRQALCEAVAPLVRTPRENAA